MIDSFALYISFLKKQFSQYCSKRLMEKGVTFSQLFIIIFVGKKESCTPKEICQGLNLDAGHLNRTINKLVENDILIQKKNANDKRSNIITLSNKGKEVLEMSYALFYEWDNVLLDCLDESEKEMLIKIMRKIVFSAKKL